MIQRPVPFTLELIDRRQYFQHVWNRMPDGSTFDATADQFGQLGDGIRIIPPGAGRYVDGCDCGRAQHTAKIWPVVSGYAGESVYRLEDRSWDYRAIAGAVVSAIVGFIAGVAWT